jgi:hypothetical protein
MKKALAMALGAMLCVGTAAPASAASQIDFSGFYRTYFINNWNESFAEKETRTNESFFANRLVLDFAFHATDEVSTYFQLRAPGAQKWGTEAGGPGAIMYHAYGELKQDWGTVSIGRLNDAYAYLGLASVGWNPGGIATDTDWGVFDLAGDAYDGIRYENRWDNGFQLVAQFNRLDHKRYYSPAENMGDSQNTDLYILQPSFHWDTGAASLAMLYLNNQSRDSDDGADAEIADADLAALKAFFLNPAFAQSFGNINVHAEGMFGWGKDHAVTFPGEQKSSGSGFYLDFDYNYGPGNVMLAGWWLEGTKEGSEKAKNLVGSGATDLIGGGFQPFIVAYGDIRSGSRVSAVGQANAYSAANPLDEGYGNNHWAVALAGSHGFTDDVALNYTLGYMALNKVAEGKKKDIGWEADLGFDVQLLDNLKLNTAFGYLAAGKALDDVDNNIKAKDGYTWYNTLTFSF